MSIDNEKLRQETRGDSYRMVARVKRIAEAVEHDGLDPAIGLREMQRALDGEGEPIVKVGGPVRPDIQT